MQSLNFNKNVCDRYGLDVPPAYSRPKLDRVYALYGLDPVNLSQRVHFQYAGEDEGILKKIREKFESLREIYNRVAPQIIEKATFIVYLGSEFVAMCDSIAEIGIPVVKTVRNATDAIRNFVDTSVFTELMPKTKIFSIITVASMLHRLAGNIQKFVDAIFAGFVRKAVVKGATILSNLSDISIASATFVEGLVTFGKVTGEVAGGISYGLTVMGLVFSIPVVFLEIKRLRNTEQFEEQLDGFVKEGFEVLVEEMNKKENALLERRFGLVDGELLKAQLNQIAKNRDENANVEITKALKDRISLRKWNHRLKIIVAIISIIACSILLFSTTVLPLGFALGAVVSALTIVVLIIDKVASLELKKALRKYAPEDSEEVKKYHDKVKAEQWKSSERRATRRKVSYIINWQQ